MYHIDYKSSEKCKLNVLLRSESDCIDNLQATPSRFQECANIILTQYVDISKIDQYINS